MGDLINAIVQDKTIFIIVLSCLILIVILLIVLIVVSNKSKKKKEQVKIENTEVEQTNTDISNNNSGKENVILSSNTNEIENQKDTPISESVMEPITNNVEPTIPETVPVEAPAVNEQESMVNESSIKEEPKNEDINVGEISVPVQEEKIEPVLENVNQSLPNQFNNTENIPVVNSWETNNELSVPKVNSESIETPELPINEVKVQPVENEPIEKAEEPVNLDIPKVLDVPVETKEIEIQVDNSNNLEPNNNIAENNNTPKVEEEIFKPIEQIPVNDVKKEEPIIEEIILDDNNDTPLEPITNNVEPTISETVQVETPAVNEQESEKEKLLRELNEQKEQQQRNNVNEEMFSTLEDLKIK